ncbi:MAG: PQQ-binding-like beta-propeller repeat protein [Acidobacteria bacterium]|nr:PQQ-binding-like beta-propeller repeat protein [Acidobacteriota bacterium]
MPGGRMSAIRWALVACLVLSSGQASAQPEGRFTPVTDAEIQDPDPADWLMWRRTLDSWGYSPLDQIDRDNVGELRMVWSRALTAGRQQGTPLVYGGVLYMPNPRDVIQALDAVTGDLLWEYRRDRPDDLTEYIITPLSEGNRNLAIHDNLIIDTSTDGYVFALEAATGRLAWETRIVDYKVHPAHQTSGPIIANGKVVSGRGCIPKAGPEACFIAAHDAATGAELWRTRLVPAPGEPGDETWGGVPFEDRRHVGSWMVPSYDPELNLVYVGTSVTSPTPKFMLGGRDLEHLYHNSTLALDADIGDIVWYYQHLTDHWDLDHPFERILVDTAVAPDAGAVDWINPRLRPGEVRRVLTGIPGKTGVVYTLDRATGEFLWATPTIAQNVISHIDGATGSVAENSEVVFSATGQQVTVCPSWYGGKDWEAGAYSPLTNAMYMPLRNTCAQQMSVPYEENPFLAVTQREELAPGVEELGMVLAISAETGETLWRHDQRAATTSLAATGGGLVFGGDAHARLRAQDHQTRASLI